MTLFHLSIALNVLFGTLLVGCVYLLARSGKVINEYESFYESTIEQIEEHLRYLNTFLRKNVVVANDDDVKRVHVAMRDFYHMLLGYSNARRTDRSS